MDERSELEELRKERKEGMTDAKDENRTFSLIVPELCVCLCVFVYAHRHTHRHTDTRPALVSVFWSVVQSELQVVCAA